MSEAVAVAPASVLSDLLGRSAAAHPDRRAVVDRDTVWTYAELHDRVGRLTAVLVELGVGPGSRVGVFMDKSADTVAVLHAVLRREGPTSRSTPSRRPPAWPTSCATARSISW